MLTDEACDRLLATALRDGEAGWPATTDARDAARLLARADLHGVAPLLHDRLGAGAALPEPLRQGLRRLALGSAMRDLAERGALARLLPALDARGLHPLLFKGVALAYALYETPALRPRADVDLLVGPDERAAATEALAALGWQARSARGAEVATRQAAFRLTAPGDVELHLDLHWRIGESPLLYRVLPHADLWARSTALTQLHPLARAPHPRDALVIACVHRLIHSRTPYFEGGAARLLPDRLIWLNDIRLLAGVLSANDWDDLQRQAAATGLARTCRDGLEAARSILGAEVPPPILGALGRAGRAGAADAYLAAGWLRRDWMDLRAAEGARGKMRFLAEALFPPGDYMRARDKGAARGPLPWLYLRRILGGLGKRLRGSPHPKGPR